MYMSYDMYIKGYNRYVPIVYHFYKDMIDLHTLTDSLSSPTCSDTDMYTPNPIQQNSNQMNLLYEQKHILPIVFGG